MKREKFTEKLVRMIETIEANALPAKVKKLYVFGSYARGALEPGDLDLIVIYQWPPKAAFEAWVQEKVTNGVGGYEAVHQTAHWIKATMKAAFRRPGERIHLVLERSLDDFVRPGSTVQREDLVLLWSQNDRDWRTKLNGIRSDPRASKAARNHFFPLERFRDHLGSMNDVMEMLADGRLQLTNIAFDHLEPALDPDHARWLAHWAKCKVMGKESMKMLPYAMHWLQSHQERCAVPSRTNIWSQSQTHRVEVGRPSLARMLDVFESHPKVERQCLIPNFKKAGPNELLIFEHGPNWRENG